MPHAPAGEIEVRDPRVDNHGGLHVATGRDEVILDDGDVRVGAGTGQDFGVAVGDRGTLPDAAFANIVPIQGIIRQPSADAVPNRFRICNGATVNEPGSPLDGQPTPDLTSLDVSGTLHIIRVI